MKKYKDTKFYNENQKEFTYYNTLREIVQQEQVEYRAFANEMLKTQLRNPSQVANLTPDARRYAEEIINVQLQRVRNLPRVYYPAFPEDESMMRMLPAFNEQQSSTVQYEMRFENPQPLLELVCWEFFIEFLEANHS